MIKTERLFLKPLTYEQLVQYIKNDGSLETALNLNMSSRVISNELKEAFEETILPNVADTSKNYLFNTLWTAILISENIMVGDLCFVGEPNEAGEVEIGYGTYEAFRKNGYMTEAVGGLVKWAAQQPAVLSIFAATEQSNRASSVILEKNNFMKAGEIEQLFHWRLKLHNTST